MSGGQWRLLVERLQTRFDSAAGRYPDFGCVIFHYEPSERHRRDGSVVRAMIEQLNLFPAGGTDYGKAERGGEPAFREIYIQKYRPPASGDESVAQQVWMRTSHAMDELLRLAGNACDLVMQSPAAVAPSIPHIPTMGRSRGSTYGDYQSWLFLMFELAWQPPSGSPLKAERFYWVEPQGLWVSESCGPLSDPDWAWMQPLGTEAWVQRTPGFFYSKVDDVFCASADAITFLLAEPAGNGPEAASGAAMAKKAHRGAITVEEANQTAMRLAKKDLSFVNGGVREWAKRVREASGKTCSTATIHGTALWQKTMEARGRGRRKGGKAKAVSFTDSLEAVVGNGDPHEVLNRLTAEQGADFEPSPLEPDPPGKPRRVRCRKRP